MSKQSTIVRKAASAKAASAKAASAVKFDLETTEGIFGAKEAGQLSTKEAAKLLAKLAKEEEAKEVTFTAVYDDKYPHPAIRAKVGAKQLFAPLPVWRGIAENLVALQAAIVEAIALKSK
jgi:ribosomal protein L4